MSRQNYFIMYIARAHPDSLPLSTHTHARTHTDAHTRIHNNPKQQRIHTASTMNDPGLNNLLKWGIQNSEASRTDAAAADQPPPQIDVEALQRLMTGASGPSDAQLMQESMQVVRNEEAELEHRTTAFDNFEQLIENLDNANNIESLGLWVPLVEQLENKESELRFYAAWCCGTAVQNNIRTQERVSSCQSMILFAVC